MSWHINSLAAPGIVHFGPVFEYEHFPSYSYSGRSPVLVLESNSGQPGEYCAAPVSWHINSLAAPGIVHFGPVFEYEYE